MIKSDLVNEVSGVINIPKSLAEVAVNSLLDAIKESLNQGNRIELRGFGVFQIRPRKRGIGRNPRTGEEVAIPKGKTIRFKPGKELTNIQ